MADFCALLKSRAPIVPGENLQYLSSFQRGSHCHLIWLLVVIYTKTLTVFPDYRRPIFPGILLGEEFVKHRKKAQRTTHASWNRTFAVALLTGSLGAHLGRIKKATHRTRNAYSRTNSKSALFMNGKCLQTLAKCAQLFIRPSNENRPQLKWPLTSNFLYPRYQNWVANSAQQVFLP